MIWTYHNDQNDNYPIILLNKLTLSISTNMRDFDEYYSFKSSVVSPS